MERVLVAGIGNIFLGDDAFGVEVAQRLSRQPLPEFVKVADFGIRGLHLAYEMLERQYPLTVFVDLTPRGGEPGTIYLIEPDITPGAACHADAHSMTPEAVLATLDALGGRPGRILIVGCEPQQTDEAMGLSEPVSRAVDEAVKLVCELIAREGSGEHGGGAMV